MHGQSNRWLRDNKIPQALRRNLTDAERLMWQKLRGGQTGFRFRRQHAFECFVLDFVCLEAKLVVEIDGGQHVELEKEDAARTAALELAGFRVLRFWNNQVLSETDTVLNVIWGALHPSPPQPSP
jgi:very-short-patch-repair endonuclease